MATNLGKSGNRVSAGGNCILGKASKVSWKRQYMLPLMLEANPDDCMYLTQDFRSLLLCKLSSYCAGQDRQASLNASADSYFGIYSPGNLHVQFKRSFIFKMQFSWIKLYIWLSFIGQQP